MSHVDELASSTIHRTQDGEHIIITCACGEGFEHGQLELRRSTKEKAPCFYVELWFRPTWSLWGRVKQAWAVLLGRALYVDSYWNPSTCRDLAQELLGLEHTHGE